MGTILILILKCFTLTGSELATADIALAIGGSYAF